MSMDTATRIQMDAKHLGYDVIMRFAGTGSIYLTCSRADADLVIRIADHDECYPPSRGERRIDVSPGGATVGDALAALHHPELVQASSGPEPITDAERLTRVRHSAERIARAVRTVRRALGLDCEATLEAVVAAVGVDRLRAETVALHAYARHTPRNRRQRAQAIADAASVVLRATNTIDQ